VREHAIRRQVAALDLVKPVVQHRTKVRRQWIAASDARSPSLVGAAKMLRTAAMRVLNRRLVL
jgi:hypothetical protein